jgi:hypothetical protein
MPSRTAQYCKACSYCISMVSGECCPYCWAAALRPRLGKSATEGCPVHRFHMAEGKAEWEGRLGQPDRNTPIRGRTPPYPPLAHLVAHGSQARPAPFAASPKFRTPSRVPPPPVPVHTPASGGARTCSIGASPLGVAQNLWGEGRDPRQELVFGGARHPESALDQQRP